MGIYCIYPLEGMWLSSSEERPWKATHMSYDMITVGKDFFKGGKYQSFKTLPEFQMRQRLGLNSRSQALATRN
jgi:hypothetical protein